MSEEFGALRKMRVKADDPVSYWLPVGNREIELASLLGQSISLEYDGHINCIECGRSTRKSFNQGYCFPCLRALAACDMCIVKPELCHFHLGTCREPNWGEQHCMQPHVVYLANSSALKVGVTRQSQVPTRWIDQGCDAGTTGLRGCEPLSCGPARSDNEILCRRPDRLATHAEGCA